MIAQPNSPQLRRQPVRLPIARVHPDPDQPRKVFDWDTIKELAASIRNNGQWVDIIVRPHPTIEGDYLLVDGERRLRAMPLVPSDEIGALVVEGALDPGQLLLVQTSLGLTSQRLDPLELGESCLRLMHFYGQSPGELADRLGTSESTISKLLRITNHLVEELRADVKAGVVPFTVAYHLARLRTEADQIRVAGLFRSGVLCRDGVANEVFRTLNGGTSKGKQKRCKVWDGATSIEIPAAANWEFLKTLGTRLIKAATVGEKSPGVSPALALSGILKTL